LRRQLNKTSYRDAKIGELYMIKPKMLLRASIFAVGLLCVMEPAYAQSGPIGPIPKSMSAEHEELHSDLATLTQAGGQTGQAAISVADVLDKHFAKENQYALPRFSLLVPLSQGEFECGMTEVLKRTDKLEAEMPTMLAEHKVIVAALEKLRAAATAENKPAGVQFADHLTAHAQAEEEITYPTALLIRRYVREKAVKCDP
jgi:hypothetical protein